MENSNNTQQKIIARDSNIELLRIFAISLVVWVHFSGYGLAQYKSNFFSSWAIFHSFLVIGVDTFVMISGYYGIKLKWKSLINLFCICFFYSILITLFKWIALDEPFSIRTLIYAFMPISTQWWFVNCYFCLMLCAPFLNKAIDNLKNNEMIVVLILLSIVNFYFGFAHRSIEISFHGYNLANFIFVYYVGRVVKRFESKLIFNKYYFLLIYVVSSLVIAALMIFSWHISNGHDDGGVFRSYNNPLIILSSAAVLLFFKQISIKSQFVNWVAASVLAVYLIHMKFINYLYLVNTNVFTRYIVYLILLFVGVFVVSILIDKIRIFITTPIVLWLTKLAKKISHSILVKFKIYQQ